MNTLTSPTTICNFRRHQCQGLYLIASCEVLIHFTLLPVATVSPWRELLHVLLWLW